MPDPWIFKQLEGDKKELRLAGTDAPHGRPRQHPVVVEGGELRQKETFYSGNNEPTRHIGGLKFRDIELKGRFSDRYGGAGHAKAKAEEVKGFWADMQQIEVTWGDALAVRGVMHSFEPGRESAGEIPWTMAIRVDQDMLLATAIARGRVEPQAKPPGETAAAMSAMLNELTALKAPNVPLKGTVFDAIDSLVSLATDSLAVVVDAADQMRSYEQALVGDLRRLRAGFNQLRTAISIFAETIEAFQSAVRSELATDQFSFTSLQASAEVTCQRLMLEILEADQAAARAERGKLKGLYAARDGDTWETISIAAYGVATRANDIRTANGIAPGARPDPSAIYFIPR